MELRDGKTERVSKLIARIHPNIERLLVVGCGDGVEAAVLARELGAKVTGIDVLDDFLPAAQAVADLHVGDATALEFPDDSFDFVYSFHALEHIDRPDKALAEIARVLKPDGGYWIGTPNRARLLGYIGSKSATLGQKVAWNLKDWGARLTGRFRNEYGAHAGFTRGELGGLLAQYLPAPVDESLAYYREIYPSKHGMIDFMRSSGIDRVAFPAVYFSGRGGRAAN